VQREAAATFERQEIWQAQRRPGMKALRKLTGPALLTLAVAIACAQPASGASASPGFSIESLAIPTNFSSGHGDAYEVAVANVGSKATSGEITVSDELPPGLSVGQVEFYWSGKGESASDNLAEHLCHSGAVVKCTFPVPLGPDQRLKLIVNVAVEAGAAETLHNRVEATGGGAAPAVAESTNHLSSAPAPFGFAAFSFDIDGADGRPDTRAGDHPYELTTNIGLDSAFRSLGPQGDELGIPTSVQDVRDVVADLPLGFVGSTLAAPECRLEQLSSESHCPADTIIGHIRTEPVGIASVDSPIYNMVPERGVPAEFGYNDTLNSTHVFYVHVVPTPAGYVLQTINKEIPEIEMDRISVTFYGDPSAKQRELAEQEGKIPSALPEVPYFTNPTACTGEPVVARIYMDSWETPGSYNTDGTPNVDDGKWVSATSQSPPMTGCDLLQFPAELRAQPTTHEADKPSGLDFELKVPQTETIGAPGTPTLKKIVTRLPEGMTVDPAAGDGLAACSEAQIGWLGGTHLDFNLDPPQCPEASKIGSLELETPLVPHRFEGEMFLAAQNENPFGATLAAYVVVNDPITGVLIKIPGEFVANPVTGQLTAVFDENPNLPFSDLKLHFFGGPRAELATPESCGTYTVGTELFPYSFPDSGPPASPFDNFVIDEACPIGFAPSFTALSTNVQAGAYTPFVASFSRSDADQELAGLTVTLPPGLVGKIAGVPLCSEAQIQEAQAGTGGCPEASEVGTVNTGVGPGPNPLFVAGKAYLTGPYNGGPYGLVVVVPAIAGPYDFGTVVVRQSIRINPRTAQVSDVSDAFPTIIDGIPLRLRRVDLTLSRPEFVFNPTSCAKEQFAGSISGSPLGAPRSLDGTVGYATQAGASASFITPFQVTDCASLKFAPKFTISTKGKSSRANGASLTAKLSYPSAPWGSQANIGRVKVSLPKQLSSRLTTLQKACTAKQFGTNPAGCPAASVVGHAIVHTPVLPAPLQGPAYFVSNGGEAFPNLIIVLQGDNVTFELVGDTFISKAGITSNTFNTVPDVPFSTFELTLGQGKYSALAANLPASAKGNFCGRKLNVPVVFDAQNGLVISHTVKAGVTGCAKAKRASRGKRRKSSGKPRKTTHRQTRGGSRRKG
jgi:hypothetical protein